MKYVLFNYVYQGETGREETRMGMLITDVLSENTEMILSRYVTCTIIA